MFAELLKVKVSVDQGSSAPLPVSAVNWATARCKEGSGAMTSLFFSEQIDDIARAKQICELCPVIDACLEGAIERREPWGVWGGQLFLNGKILAQKRKRGRPPKNPQVAAAQTA